jgi:hypothetical protein
MDEFVDLRRQLQQARALRESVRLATQRSQERIKKAAAEQLRLQRMYDRTDADHVALRRQLSGQMDGDQQRFGTRTVSLKQATELERNLFHEFATMALPQQMVGKLSDAYPMLLFPVRLETRFKIVDIRGQESYELWVRVYPDDCVIDTFEPTLSDVEAENVRIYWIEMWRAGGIETLERGAWRGLVGSHGSGRAAWIEQQYRPLNLANKPAKSTETDLILTIPTDTPLLDEELEAVASYWQAIWRADETDITEAAFEELVSIVGEERAREIVENYRPINLDEVPRPPLEKHDVEVTVALLVLPNPNSILTKQLSWTQAPRVNVFPDRLVLIGYANSAQVLEVTGEPIPSPLIVGPDPSAAPQDQLRQIDDELAVSDDMRWMVDFDEAVKQGMGFRVVLSKQEWQRGFDRLFVLGVRMSADETESQQLLETLFQHHHHTRGGLSLLPQGTPTNNTADLGAGFTHAEDADESFDDNFKHAPFFTDTPDWFRKRDGQWLAEWLGIDPEVFRKVRHSGGTDQCEARAMNVALWPATLGYMLDTLMQPLFSDVTVDSARWFFTHFVSGRGAIPAVRIGHQPYGILPTTALSRMAWLGDEAAPIIVGLPESIQHRHVVWRINNLVQTMAVDWAAMANTVSHVGAPLDPHQTLLDILGLHASSVEFHQRYAKSLPYLYNWFNFDGFGIILLRVLQNSGLLQSGSDLLRHLGYFGQDQPDILDKFFLSGQNLLKGPLIDDRPLSETDPIRAYTSDGRNYLQWLLDSASRSLEMLRMQQGFEEGQTPTALLYIMLRHALVLGYWETSLRLYQETYQPSPAQLTARRREPNFTHVTQQPPGTVESRWNDLYIEDANITGNPGQLIGDYIARNLGGRQATRHLYEQLEALRHLKDLPTARLERAFTEHIDCCAYRLDAWQLGMVHYQLAHMRYRESTGKEVLPGLYLGAFGWLEDVRPENKELKPVQLDVELEKIFNKPGDAPLMSDASNGGYIHAPSLNHAVTAAVLRNGYLVNAAPGNAQSLAVNLSSSRVRVGLSILEGIRSGQSLGALLGYQFERGLHDRYNLAEVDELIYKLRKVFPLRADRLNATKSDPDVAIEAIEARNVIDGLSLVNHIKRTGNTTYPFGKPLPSATDAQKAAIKAEVNRMLDSHDAVADLALAEGVHQAMQGNYDRASATLDAYSKGHFPPEPDVVQTPRSGIGLTHRIGLHLVPGLSSVQSPIAAIAMTPRAEAEPALNQWLATRLPPPDQVGCVVRYTNPVTQQVAEHQVTQEQLQLQPIDLLHLVQTENQQAMSELDDRVTRFVMMQISPRPDAAITIHYTQRLTNRISFFELSAMLRSLRVLVLESRPLRASDMTLQMEATQAHDETVSVDEARLIRVRSGMSTLRQDLLTFHTTHSAQLTDLANQKEAILTAIDTTLTTFIDLLARAASFAIPQTGWGFVYEWKRRTFGALLQQVADLVARWTDKLAQFDTLVAAYDALPVSTPVPERFVLLQRAELQIAAQLTTPQLMTPNDYRIALTAQRTNFANRLNQFTAIVGTATASLATLRTSILTLLPLTAFDRQAFSLDETETAVVALVTDLASMAKETANAIDRRLTSAKAQQDLAASATRASVRAKALQEAAQALLGDDFRLIPEFQLTAGQGLELENALSASQSGNLLQHVETLRDFPVDDWLHGVARVREKMQHWEQVILLAGALGTSEPDLLPTQLPFKTDDRWLALEFPPDYTFDGDRLLYTAHYSTPFNKTASQCGLLLDEWTEIIPTREETTGLAFHYDRPSTEAPQTMLLVTPTAFRSAWQWRDLVDTLHDTLNLAKQRAVEPVHIDQTPYAQLLPATVMAVTLYQISIAANLALNNNVYSFVERHDG